MRKKIEVYDFLKMLVDWSQVIEIYDAEECCIVWAGTPEDCVDESPYIEDSVESFEIVDGSLIINIDTSLR